MARTDRRSRIAGLFAIHLGLDSRATGSHGQSLESVAQPASDSADVPANGRVNHPWMAAALSRHGPDRKRSATVVCRGALHPDVAGRVSAKAFALAPGYLALQG